MDVGAELQLFCLFLTFLIFNLKAGNEISYNFLTD